MMKEDAYKEIERIDHCGCRDFCSCSKVYLKFVQMIDFSSDQIITFGEKFNFANSKDGRKSVKL